MGTVAPRHQHCSHLTSPHLTMADKSEQQQQPTMEDCSDDEEFYYNNNNNEEVNNNNSQECEDKNNNSQARAPIFSKYSDRPLNITVTAKVLFGSVSAISALNAERKKKPS